MLPIKPLPLNAIQLASGIAETLRQLVIDRVLPYQWDILNDNVGGAAKSHSIANFRSAAGLSDEPFYGMVFQDSDLYKWLEAASYALSLNPDWELASAVEEVSQLITKAQRPDGYINTYFTLKAPDSRFTNLQQAHELYCAGHFFEAAVAHHNATGARDLLDTACRFADYLVKTFGNGIDQIPGYPGHQEVEIGLIKLYEATGQSSYRDLAEYFLTQRGREPHYFELERAKPDYHEIWKQAFLLDREYAQSHAEPIRQKKAVGHAVRALYMYSAMAYAAHTTSDAILCESLTAACHTLYENTTNRQMYITGGVGSTAHGEAFTADYDLPNDTAYAETCASAALMMFAKRMADLTGEGCYYDIVERAFFNHVMAGISLSGTEFFYVGPLSVNPHAIHVNPNLRHVKTVRQPWFDCACCPTNVARIAVGITDYAFASRDDVLYVNIPMAGQVRSGRHAIDIKTTYPFGDSMRITVIDHPQTIAVRLSEDATVKTVRVNDTLKNIVPDHGYIILKDINPGNIITVRYDMTPRCVVSHPRVADNAGKAAVMRGPLVYCAEQADNGEGLAQLVIQRGLAAHEESTFAGGSAVGLAVKGWKDVSPEPSLLYSRKHPRAEETTIHLIPYYLWANRGEGEMMVHLRVI